MFKRLVFGSIVLVILASLLVLAGGVLPVLAEDSEPPVLASIGVDKLPSIDGKDSDKEWKSAAWLETGAFKMKSVYAGDTIAFLVVFEDGELNVNSSGSWVLQNGSWTQSGPAVQPDFIAMDWGTDKWNILSSADNSGQSMGWILGTESVQQNKTVSPAKTGSDPAGVSKGSVTFTGWAEDAGDSGKPAYTPNSSAGSTAPIYIKKKPSNWADAVVISEKDIDSGKAAKVADLSASELEEAWSEYKKLNAIVPAMILSKPTGSQADVEVAANWADGKWTVEIVRKLVTGNGDDLQFEDMTVDYPFTVRVQSSDTAAVLRFDKALKGLAEETQEGEKEGGCYCRTTL